jgi:hypothetical protein
MIASLRVLLDLMVGANNLAKNRYQGLEKVSYCLTSRERAGGAVESHHRSRRKQATGAAWSPSRRAAGIVQSLDDGVAERGQVIV